MLFQKKPIQILEREKPIRAVLMLQERLGRKRPYNDYHDTEKLTWCLTALYSETMNGGLDQYLSNSTGDLFHDARKLLQTANATEAVNVLSELEKIMGGTIDANRQVRKTNLQRYEDQNPKAWEECIDQLTTKLMDIWPETFEKVVAYLKSNVEHIK